MNGFILSHTFAMAMSRGKYSKWATGLTADTLEALLWLVGEFGSRWAAMKLPDGTFPATRFHRDPGMSERRMRNALEMLATIQADGRTDWSMPSGWEQDLAAGTPVFAQYYRERLSRGVQTSWAKNLDEPGLGLVVWMVGEYGIRAISSQGPDGGAYPPPTFEGEPRTTGPMRTALVLLVDIFSGDQIGCSDVIRRMAEEAV